ncbi:MAG: hypothetical protein Q8R82_11300 [Hyphomonadaceae bacterium]|nr:hypothetical protein [Hyphomonadaceae bacterium]
MRGSNSTRKVSSFAPAVFAVGLCLSVSVLSTSPAKAQTASADAWGRQASQQAAQVREWVIATGDNSGLPFVIIDKVQAKVFVFAGDGQIQGSAAALLGVARGDTTVAGIGERELSTIRPEERTTPAGRFISALGRDLANKDVLWVDYAASVSLHAVVTSNPKEHRLQRLATASPLDNRISFGCINVPPEFFEGVVRPAFAGTYGIVYVLPELAPISQAIAGYAGADALAGRAASAPMRKTAEGIPTP